MKSDDLRDLDLEEMICKIFSDNLIGLRLTSRKDVLHQEICPL